MWKIPDWARGRVKILEDYGRTALIEVIASKMTVGKHEYPKGSRMVLGKDVKQTFEKPKPKKEPKPAPINYNAMTKTEIRSLAKEKGLILNKGWTKGVMIDKLKEHLK